MKISPFVLILTAISVPAWAGSWKADYEASLGGFYGYTDYAKPYKKHKQNNLNSVVNLSGAATYEFNHEYATSLVGHLAVDSAKKVENYSQGAWDEVFYAVTETPYGDVYLGQNDNVAYAFSVGAPNIGSYHINNTELVSFINNPNWYKRGKKAAYKTLNSTYINTDGASMKASYITPQFWGIKLGATYVPETYSQSGLVAKKAQYKDEDAYILGAYGAWDVLGYELEASLGFADFHKNDKEYSAGISIYRKGWTLGASYRKTETDKNDYALNKENLFDAYREGRAYNVGIKYEIGPFSTGLAYFDSRAEKTRNHDKIISFSNSYEYNKNVTFSLTVAYLQAKGENKNININNNSKGNAFIWGMELSL